MLGEEKDPKWMQNLWRPAMGWMYMLICLLDMAVFPILWSLLQAMMHQPITQWNPLTLQGAGLFHIAMGAVLGIAAFGRTQEKLAGTAANPTATVATQNMNMSGNTAGGYGSGMNNMSGGFGSAPSFGGAPSFGQSAPGSFGSAPPAFGATPAPSFGAAAPACPTTGKPLGPAQSFPAL
jgi:hypothetical protein